MNAVGPTTTSLDLGFQPSRVTRPRQQVEEQIRHAILSGSIENGGRLPSEANLAEQFAVSRPTVREALAALAEKGLIVRKPGRHGGSFVQYVDHIAVGTALSERLSSTLELGSLSYAEVAEFRDMLEVPSARLAAMNRTDEDIARMMDTIEREKYIHVSDPSGRDINIEFHLAIAKATHNRLLMTFVAELHHLTRPVEYIDWTEEAGAMGVQHHIAVVRAIRAKQPDEAAQAMRDHLQYLREHVGTEYRALTARNPTS